MVYQISNELLTLAIDGTGGAMQHMVFDGQEYLWQGDPTYWREQAPHLFPMLAAVFLLLAACAHRPDPQATTMLSQAEAIMYAAPDSALQLLENLQPPKGKEQRATWALLLAQARYKSNVRQSDSLVNTAYNYFKKTDDAERKALALYLKGGIKHEEKLYEEAQAYYLKAKDEVEKTDNDRLSFLIYANLGNLYAYRGVKAYAYKAYEKSRSRRRHKSCRAWRLNNRGFRAFGRELLR